MSGKKNQIDTAIEYWASARDRSNRLRLELSRAHNDVFEATTLLGEMVVPREASHLEIYCVEYSGRILQIRKASSGQFLYEIAWKPQGSAEG